MKSILLLVAVLPFFNAFQTKAQILNSDFETWTTAQGCSNPTSWGTLNGSTAILGICTAQRETVPANVHGGASALTLVTEFIGFPINQTAPGIVTSGIVNTQTEQVEGGHPFTERPTAFTGWYLAAPQSGDNYSFSALLIDEVSTDTVGRAEWSGTATVSTYTMFTATITYDLITNPTMLQIILLPSSSSNPVVGSSVTFDDLGYYTDPVGTLEREQTAIAAYPNPANTIVTFNLGKEQQADVSIFNILGVKVAESRLGSSNQSVSSSELANGAYFWQMCSLQGTRLKSGKIIIAH